MTCPRHTHPVVALIAASLLLSASRAGAQGDAPPTPASDQGVALSLEGSSLPGSDDAVSSGARPASTRELARHQHALRIRRAGWTLAAFGLGASLLLPVSSCVFEYPTHQDDRCRDAAGLITVNVAMLTAGVVMGIRGTQEARRLAERDVGLAPTTPGERRLRRFGWAMAVLLGSIYLGANVVTWFFSGVAND